MTEYHAEIRYQEPWMLCETLHLIDPNFDEAVPWATFVHPKPKKTRPKKRWWRR